MKTDTPAALAFLEQWLTEGPWVLTSISTDRKGIKTDTFDAASVDELTEWIDRYNGKRNIYFHVNPPMHKLTKKAEREDIKELAWLHVDVDPRQPKKGLSKEELSSFLESEQHRALDLFLKPPNGVPQPTVVVYSGGGYQGFWKLREPIHIGGDLGIAEDLKRYNIQLEILFDADNCHNIDRIMRLPGTINLPDAKKLKKGRVEVLAELISFNNNVYDISEFTPAPAVATLGEGSLAPTGQEATVKISGNIARLADVNELDEWQVPDRIKVIIVQGKHPDEESKEDNSRSAWLFDAVCGMVRCDVPDEVMYSVIMDPDFHVSESVLDKGSNSHKYAIKQITSAKEFAIDPILKEFNSKYAVVRNIGGRCRVIEEQIDPALGRSILTMMDFGNFRNGHMNKKVSLGVDSKGNEQFMPAGEWWLRHKKRRQYDRVVFSPMIEVPGSYNLWKGFSCEAIPGNCALYLTHLKENVCHGEEEYYDYLISWMARLIQHPNTPGQVAVVLRGGRGTGKGFFAGQLGALLGRHYLQISNPSYLVGNFNNHLRDAILIFGDEAFYAGDKKHESILKTLITEEIIAIEAKGVDIEIAPNYVHVILASNAQWIVPAGGDERRFFVLDVADTHKQDSDYFGAIAAQMKIGGKEALLHHLLTHDLTGYEVRNVPKTLALQDQKAHSFNADESWWYEKLTDGNLLIQAAEEQWPTNILKSDLYDDHSQFMRDHRVARPTFPVQVGKFLKLVCPGIRAWQGKRGNKRPYFYALPPLDVCRESWEVSYGPQNWEDTITVLNPDEDEQEVF